MAERPAQTPGPLSRIAHRSTGSQIHHVRDSIPRPRCWSTSFGTAPSYRFCFLKTTRTRLESASEPKAIGRPLELLACLKQAFNLSPSNS